MMPLSPGSWWVRACPSAMSCPTLCNPIGCSLTGSSVPGDSPGKNTGVGCHALLRVTFPTQGLNPPLVRGLAKHTFSQPPPWLVGSECSQDLTTQGPQESSQPHSWLTQNGGAFSDSCTCSSPNMAGTEAGHSL